MSFRDGNKSVLRFVTLLESVNLPFAEGNSPWRLMNTVNSTPWMGKEPGSCMVIDIQQAAAVPQGKTALIDHAEFAVLVGYRPEGWISDVKLGGRQRLNGWKVERLDEEPDGTLLDGKGGPLPPGGEPVFLQFTMYPSADYNEFEFGQLLGEGDGDGQRVAG